MTIIKFPDSSEIRMGSGGADMNRYETGAGRNTDYSKDRSDIVEISVEAKMKFNKDNIVKLEKVKAMKEAREYSDNLDAIIKFKEADLRKIYRLNKINDANNKLSAKFYSENEDSVLRRLLDMPNV